MTSPKDFRDPMTQDEPERVKVDRQWESEKGLLEALLDLQEAKARLEAQLSATAKERDDAHTRARDAVRSVAFNARVNADLRRELADRLSVSEKRAEEAEARAKFDRETLQARETLGGALGMDMNECVVEATKRVCKQYERERDEARAALQRTLKDYENEVALITAERDSSQASLLRVEKALAHVEQWLTAWAATPEDKPDRDSWIRGRNRIVEVVRTALSPHTEK